MLKYKGLNVNLTHNSQGTEVNSFLNKYTRVVSQIVQSIPRYIAGRVCSCRRNACVARTKKTHND